MSQKCISALEQEEFFGTGTALYPPQEELELKDSSPLRRALSTHFSQFKGLTAPKAEFDENIAIYKDTSSGNIG